MEVEHVVVFITIDTAQKAEELAKELVERRLCACVNVVDEVKSIYTWQGKVEKATERLMVVKTKRELFDELARTVKELHPYEVPEIIALPMIAGFKPYLDWINDVTGSG